PSVTPTPSELAELVRLAHHLVTGPFKCRREFLKRYRRHRPADATLDRFNGNSVRPAVPDEDDGGLHFSFVHVAGERRGGKKVSNRLVPVREAALDVRQCDDERLTVYRYGLDPALRNYI